ncbi:MAG TPA: hypothetical protein VF763_13105 [Candidatus Limnocylindrales bacterium]
MIDRLARVADVLERAERTHGIVTARTNGADPEWPLFYAWWLLRWSELPELLAPAPAPTISVLAARLLALDADYRRAAPPEPWSIVYARALLADADARP